MADLPITSDQGATPVVINDPTTPTNVANVKAASTAAVVGDNSLVVALSPNSSVPTGTNTIGNVGVTQGSTTSGQSGVLDQASVTTASPVYITGQTSPLSLTTSGALRVQSQFVGAGTQEVFGPLVTSNRNNEFENIFFNNTYLQTSLITTSGGATVTQANGQGTLASSTAVTASVSVQTLSKITYSVGHEIYAMATVAFTTPTSAASNQRWGLYNSTDGFYIGFNGTTFQAVSRKASVDNATSQASFNLDTLTGTAGSLFTSNGVPVAINFTDLNLFRIRYGWLGVAPIVFEVCSPDGVFVAFHIIRYPNTSANVSVNTPVLPMTMEINKTASNATNLQMQTGAWAAGTTRTNDVSNFDFSSANLTSSSSYTTPWFDTFAQGGSFVMAILADQPITYQVQASPDQSIIKSIATGVVAANQSFSSPYLGQARYVRIIYTNSGASTTTSVFFSTIQNKFNQQNAISLQDISGNIIASTNANSTFGLNVALAGTSFFPSTNNSSTVQLAAAATFTGTIETIFNQQTISVLLTSDQPGTLTLNQYIDLAGTRKTNTYTWFVDANIPFSQAFTANGNYFNASFKNTGASTTTTLNLNIAYGTLPSVDNAGYFPVDINASADQSAAANFQTFTTSFEVNLPTAGTETVAFYLKNPSTSGRSIVLKRLCTLPTGITNGSVTFRMYGDPTSSANGTAQTISTTSIGSGIASVMTAFSSPTVSANGSKLFAVTSAVGNVTAGTSMPIDFDGLIRVAANHNLLITGQPTSNNTNCAFTVIWQEV